MNILKRQYHVSAPAPTVCRVGVSSRVSRRPEDSKQTNTEILKKQIERERGREKESKLYSEVLAVKGAASMLEV